MRIRKKLGKNVTHLGIARYSVADRHHIDTNPDPTFHFDADPDPAPQYDANPCGSRSATLAGYKLFYIEIKNVCLKI